MGAAETRKVRVAAESELQESAGRVVVVEGRSLALFRIQGQCFATANACPHKGGPLGEGRVREHVVTCPWHGWTWDVRTGANVRNPKLGTLECFPVSVEGGEVFVHVPSDQGPG